jgi:hypothetical protein
MDGNLYRLAYCSRNTFPVETDIAAELRAILEVSRRNNARNGLTGALLFSRGSFGQILEGEYCAVERTFEHIQNDERHGDVVVLTFEPVTARGFGPWSMAHVGAEASADDALHAMSSAEFNPADCSGRELFERLRGILVTREEQPRRA